MPKMKFWWLGENTVDVFKGKYHDLIVGSGVGMTAMEQDQAVADAAASTVRHFLGEFDKNSNRKPPAVKLSQVFSTYDLRLNEFLHTEWFKMENLLGINNPAGQIGLLMEFASEDNLGRVAGRGFLPTPQYLIMKDNFKALRFSILSQLEINDSPSDI